jgi:hypothetical protein
LGNYGWYLRNNLRVCNLVECVTVYSEVLWSTEDPRIGDSEDHKLMERGGVVWDKLEGVESLRAISTGRCWRNL